MAGRVKPISKQQYDQIQKLTKAGWSQREIGQHLGINQTTVLKWQNKAFPEGEGLSSHEDLANEVFRLFSASKSKKWTVSEISDRLDVGVSRVSAAVEELQKQGKNLHVDAAANVELLSTIAPSDPMRINVKKFKGRKFTIGVTADNHLGSKYARLDVINALFDIWQEQGVTEVYNCGNMIDGDARFNKYDLLVHGMEAQANYFAEYWPQREGMVTRFITGDDHEGWYVQREGVVIGDYLSDVARRHGRTDLEYLGHMEHDIVFEAPNGSSTMRLIHAGGGTAYALSYTSQSIINSYQGGEKPNILLIGHYHKAEFNYWREVLNLQVGCTEDQTTFMRKKNIQAHVGGWTVSFEIDDNGIVHGFTPQWHPFFDRSFYGDKKWGYLWDKAKRTRSSKKAA